MEFVLEKCAFLFINKDRETQTEDILVNNLNIKELEQ